MGITALALLLVTTALLAYLSCALLYPEKF